MKIKYGGELEFGDLIAVADGSHISFGFYAGTGIGTIQYYPIYGPTMAYERYTDWLKLSNHDKFLHHMTHKYEKGFSSVCMTKSYAKANINRIMKVTDPEGVFTDPDDLNEYQESKEILIKIGMIKTK